MLNFFHKNIIFIIKKIFVGNFIAVKIHKFEYDYKTASNIFK